MFDVDALVGLTGDVHKCPLVSVSHSVEVHGCVMVGADHCDGHGCDACVEVTVPSVKRTDCATRNHLPVEPVVDLCGATLCTTNVFTPVRNSDTEFAEPDHLLPGCAVPLT